MGEIQSTCIRAGRLKWVEVRWDLLKAEAMGLIYTARLSGPGVWTVIVGDEILGRACPIYVAEALAQEHFQTAWWSWAEM